MPRWNIQLVLIVDLTADRYLVIADTANSELHDAPPDAQQPNFCRPTAFRTKREELCRDSNGHIGDRQRVEPHDRIGPFPT